MSSKLGIPANGGQSLVFQMGECVCALVNGDPKVVTPIYTWNFKTQSFEVQLRDSLGNLIDPAATVEETCFDDCTNCPTTLVPAMDLTKEGNLDGGWAVGETITYTLTVTNSGQTQLDNVRITDAMLGLTDEPCNPSTLQPGDQVLHTGWGRD